MCHDDSAWWFVDDPSQHLHIDDASGEWFDDDVRSVCDDNLVDDSWWHVDHASGVRYDDHGSGRRDLDHGSMFFHNVDDSWRYVDHASGVRHDHDRSGGWDFNHGSVFVDNLVDNLVDNSWHHTDDPYHDAEHLRLDYDDDHSRHDEHDDGRVDLVLDTGILDDDVRADNSDDGSCSRDHLCAGHHDDDHDSA